MSRRGMAADRHEPRARLAADVHVAALTEQVRVDAAARAGPAGVSTRIFLMPPMSRRSCPRCEPRARTGAASQISVATFPPRRSIDDASTSATLKSAAAPVD